jgi:hypothetical protein
MTLQLSRKRKETATEGTNRETETESRKQRKLVESFENAQLTEITKSYNENNQFAQQQERRSKTINHDGSIA